MTYNQVQSFQINDYANHYVDIEITGYRALYSERIAGRGVARLISWLGTAGPVNCFNKSMSDCYIRVYRSFGRVQLRFGWAYSWLLPLNKTQILEVYLRNHTRQLEYNKHAVLNYRNLLQIRFYFSSLSISIHKANLLKVASKNNLQSSARGFYHR